MYVWKSKDVPFRIMWWQGKAADSLIWTTKIVGVFSLNFFSYPLSMFCQTVTSTHTPEHTQFYLPSPLLILVSSTFSTSSSIPLSHKQFLPASFFINFLLISTPSPIPSFSSLPPFISRSPALPLSPSPPLSFWLALSGGGCVSVALCRSGKDILSV